MKEQYYTEEEKEAERKKQGGEKYQRRRPYRHQPKKEGKAFKSERYEHNYPHCWRTDKPVLYYPLDLVHPDHRLKDRMAGIEYHHQLETRIDRHRPLLVTGGEPGRLEPSRSRYWGIPLPIWRSEDAQEELCIGSIEQLREEMKKSIAAGFMDAKHPEHIDPAQPDFDLHRPYVDNIKLVSPTGKKMFREADPHRRLVLIQAARCPRPVPLMGDPATAPFNKGHPSLPLRLHRRRRGPDPRLVLYLARHRRHVVRPVAFRNVVSNGLVLDKNGNKMSKRLGRLIRSRR